MLTRNSCQHDLNKGGVFQPVRGWQKSTREKQESLCFFFSKTKVS